MKERNLYDQLSLRDIFKKLSESPDRALFNYFFNKYYPKLIWFALVYVKQHNLAEEIVSDVMLNIFRKREKLAASDNIEGYIFISIKNQSLKYLRKNKNYIFIENYENEADLVIPTYQTPEYELISKEFHGVVRNAIEALPPKRRLVFCLIKEEGLKYQDVARLLELSVKTVETHMGLALKSINECVENYKNDRKVQTPVLSIKK